MLCKLDVTRRGLASNVKNWRSANHQLRWWTLKLHHPFQQRNWSIKSKFSWIRSRFNLLAQKFKISYSISVAHSPQFNRGHPFSEELEYECGLETVKPWAAIGTEPWMRGKLLFLIYVRKLYWFLSIPHIRTPFTGIIFVVKAILKGHLFWWNCSV